MDPKKKLGNTTFTKLFVFLNLLQQRDRHVGTGTICKVLVGRARSCLREVFRMTPQRINHLLWGEFTLADSVNCREERKPIKAPLYTRINIYQQLKDHLSSMSFAFSM